MRDSENVDCHRLALIGMDEFFHNLFGAGQSTVICPVGLGPHVQRVDVRDGIREFQRPAWHRYFVVRRPLEGVSTVLRFDDFFEGRRHGCAVRAAGRSMRRAEGQEGTLACTENSECTERRLFEQRHAKKEEAMLGMMSTYEVLGNFLPLFALSPWCRYSIPPRQGAATRPIRHRVLSI